MAMITCISNVSNQRTKNTALMHKHQWLLSVLKLSNCANSISSNILKYTTRKLILAQYNSMEHSSKHSSSGMSSLVSFIAKWTKIEMCTKTLARYYMCTCLFVDTWKILHKFFSYLPCRLQYIHNSIHLIQGPME